MNKGIGTHMRACSRLLAILAAALCLTFAVAAAAHTWPEAPGTVVRKDGNTEIDWSCAADGYLSVRYTGPGGKPKLRISKGDMTYTYDLAAGGVFEAFPLQMGSGKYSVKVYWQVSGTNYSQDSSSELSVSLHDENAAYLCPSQYVWYTKESLAVAKSAELCADLESNKAAADAVYEYIVDHMVYNCMLALTVQSGYLPDVEAVYVGTKGICFDFAALMACMLRAQDIPTRVVIGYADENYHAWNEVLIDGEWVHYDTTAAITNIRVKVYTPERYY